MFVSNTDPGSLNPVNPHPARALVFGTSAAVLVLEILAGRLMAPYVGISLETFTGIIGTVLAGIAAGSAIGGSLADKRDPRTLIGPSLLLGGALTWLSLPIVRIVGPLVDTGPVSIVVLTALAFLPPAAVLSAVGPMVAKLRLASLDDTGAVVGGLSAAGTVGALAGTFVTGFVLVSALPTQPIVIGIGAALIVSGVVAGWRLHRDKPTPYNALGLVAAGLFSFPAAPPCDHETAYFCVNVIVSDDNPSGRDLVLDRLRHAFIDLDDPTNLDVRYIRLFADVAAAQPEPASDILHIGGGGFSFPRYLHHIDDATTNLVLEIDADLVQINRDELGLVTDERLQVTTGDARLALDELASDRFDLVVGDAFASQSVPWHLTTTEFMTQIDRVMTADGIYVMNVIDGVDSRFARAELATLRQTFANVAVILPPGGLVPDRPINQILIASHQPIPPITVDPDDGQLRVGDIEDYIDGQRPLRDDFAPADQLVAD